MALAPLRKPELVEAMERKAHPMRHLMAVLAQEGHRLLVITVEAVAAVGITIRLVQAVLLEAPEE